MQWFTAILIVMLFYSLGITLYAHALPEDSLDYVTSFSDLAGEISLSSVGEQVQDSIEEQTTIPVIELGALVFYSSNIILDLLLNFAFAIPEMIGLLLYGLMMLLNIDPVMVNTIQLFFTVIITVLYFLSIITLLTSIRSGRAVV